MKKLILLSLIVLVLGLAACKKDKDTEPKRTQTTIRTYKAVNASSGKTDTVFINGSIYVWENNDGNLEINSLEQAVEGYAYNKATNQMVKYTADNRHGILVTELLPGRYLAFAIDDVTDGAGQLAYSHTYFELNEEPKLFMDKTFSLNAQAGRFEAWK